jgi:tetratricopeptide (TPR) repeat protein
MKYIAFFVTLFGIAVFGVAQITTAKQNGSNLSELAQNNVRPLVSGERVRVQKLTRDMESAMQTLNKGGVKPFQNPEYVKKWQASVERYRAALQRYPQVEDPDVKAAAAKLAEMENMVKFGIQQAAKQKESLGDVQGTMRNIETALRKHRAPQWLPAPFDDAEAKNWLSAAADAQQIAKRAISELQRIAKTAHLPNNRGTVQSGAPYDKNDLNRLLNFANSTLGEVNEAMQTTQRNLKHQAEMQNSELEYYRNLDPKNEKDRMVAFLGEGSEAEIYAGLDKQLSLAESVAAYQRAFGKHPNDKTVARIEEIKSLRESYAENLRKALGESKLPKSRSSDSQRLAIAKRILVNPRYEFGRHGPIVLTTESIVDKEKEVSRAEIKDVDITLSGEITLSGTKTTWTYKWQEFKFATPIKEEESDDWHIWWITAKNFSSGSEKTPIGEWVSGSVTKGSRILEKSFQ